MTRYAALLRGVYPSNARNPDLVRAFEAAGFKDVKTVMTSGNVLFDASSGAVGTLERKAEAALKKQLGRTWFTVVRPVEELRALVASDPYAGYRLAPGAKRIVMFMRAAPRPAPRLPVEQDGARILCVRGREAFGAYVRSPKGPVFMLLIERTFGTEVTTRTWDSVIKVAR
jgi:uncharacterized protein (DUF1697 family)